MFLCVFCFCREDYNGITTFTELLNFTGKICLFYINKELHFFSQLLQYFMLHWLIYKKKKIIGILRANGKCAVSFYPSEIGKQLDLI